MGDLGKRPHRATVADNKHWGKSRPTYPGHAVEPVDGELMGTRVSGRLRNPLSGWSIFTSSHGRRVRLGRVEVAGMGSLVRSWCLISGATELHSLQTSPFPFAQLTSAILRLRRLSSKEVGGVWNAHLNPDHGGMAFPPACIGKLNPQTRNAPRASAVAVGCSPGHDDAHGAARGFYNYQSKSVKWHSRSD